VLAADKEEDEADISLIVIKEEDDIPEHMTNEKFMSFLRMMAEKKNIQSHNLDSWVDVVLRKLWDIEIKNHAELVTELFNMDNKLRCAGSHSMFHMSIMSTIAEVAGGYITYLQSNLQPDNSLEVQATLSKMAASQQGQAKTENDDDEGPVMVRSEDCALLATLHHSSLHWRFALCLMTVQMVVMMGTHDLSMMMK
jgi:hypothetical protein